LRWAENQANAQNLARNRQQEYCGKDGKGDITYRSGIKY